MSIPQKALTIARNEEGYVEGRNNWTKYARDQWPDVQNQAWCGSFAGWCFWKAGFDMRGKVWVPYVPYIVAWAKKIGAWTTKSGTQKDGDLVVFNWGGRGAVDHVGISWRDERPGVGYRSVEGNTSPSNKGSQGNGGGVYVRYRKRSDIAGWVQMDKVLAHYGVSVPSVAAGGASVPAASKPAAKPAATKAPAFPLPRKKGAMYYYGPASGPKTSVSGMGPNSGVPGDVVKVGGRWKSKGLAEFQARLIARGWSELEKDGPDGRFGDRMHKVVGQFQKAMGLTVDHKIGPDTWAAAWTEPVK